MLVLTRRQGESIVISDNIKLTVVSVGPGRVKIGITAPPNVRIDREEIHSRIHQAQIQQENGSDVLAAVTSEVIDSQSNQNTIINSAPETRILNSQTPEKVPDEPHIVSISTPLSSMPKMTKFRPPRKPR
jgi:carbon storage regulator